MAEPNETKNATTPETAPTRTEISALPQIESPPLSPGDTHKLAPQPGVAVAPDNSIVLTLPAIRIPKFKMPKFAMPHVAMPKIGMPKIARRTQRNAFFTASLMLAACCGAAAGALAILHTPRPVVTDYTGVEEREVLRKSIDQLAKDVSALKASFASTGKAAAAQTQIQSQQFTKLTERLDKMERAREATGSIATPAPQTAEVKDVPIPTPKPVAAQPTVLSGWTIVQARGNNVVVEGRGEVFLARPGAQLPGLGAVESVKRDGNRWVVTTPKGIIVSDASLHQQQRKR